MGKNGGKEGWGEGGGSYGSYASGFTVGDNSAAGCFAHKFVGRVSSIPTGARVCPSTGCRF